MSPEVHSDNQIELAEAAERLAASSRILARAAFGGSAERIEDAYAAVRVAKARLLGAMTTWRETQAVSNPAPEIAVQAS